MQLLESKVCIWETTVHIKAQLDFFLIPRQLSKTNEQSCCCNWTRFIPCCLIFTAAWGAYKGQDSLLFFYPIPQNLSFQSAQPQNPWGEKYRNWPRICSCSSVFWYLGTKSFSLSSMSTVCLLSDIEGFLEMLDVICTSGVWKLNGNKKQTNKKKTTPSQQ